jgi:tape measure domain-containing protein
VSSEVGAGHISIFPVMTGFKKSVRKEVASAGNEGSKAFATSMRGGGRKAGTQLGRDVKDGFKNSVTGLASDGMKKLSADVAAASRSLSKSRLTQQDAAAKTKVAEQQLLETWEKFPAGSSQVIRAQERLDSAMRREAEATNAVTNASTRLKDAQKTLSDAQSAAQATNTGLGASLRKAGANFRSGFNDLSAGKDAATGVSGALGSLTKAITGPVVSGIDRLRTEVDKLRAGWANADSAMLDGAGALGRIGGAARTSADAVTGFVSKGASAVATFVKDTASYVGGWVSSTARIMGSAVSRWASPVTSVVGKAASAVAKPFIAAVRAVGGYLAPIGGAVASLAGKLGPAIGSGVSSMASAFGRGISSMVQAAGRGASQVASALANGLSGPATAVVSAAAAGIGVALTKGFSRLTAIDTAQAKLRGLGNDAGQVDAIMASASRSVKGTAFGLGEAATTAAAAVAAGIKPGQGLDQVLSTVANNASAAGTSMSDMGSIFTRAASQANGVQNDVIQQLADRGIPIYQALADQLGVTSGEVFKMASDGKIDFATFSAAAEKAAGTVATEMGTTVPGAFKNTMASVGRIGANLMSGIYPKIAPLLQAITSALGPVEEKATAIGEVLGAKVGPVLDQITGKISGLGEGKGLSALTQGLSGLSGILGPLGGAFAALGAGGLSTVLSKLGPLGKMIPGLGTAMRVLTGPIGLLVGAFAGLVATSPELQSALGGLVTGVLSSLMGIVEQLQPVFAQLMPVLAQVGGIIAGVLAQALVALTPVITQLVTIAGGLIAQVLPLLVPILTQIGAVIAQVLPILLQVVSAVLPPLMGLVQALVPVFMQVVQVVLQIVAALLPLIPPIAQLIGALLPPLVALFAAVLPPVIALASAILDSLMPVIDGLMTFLQGLINFVTGVFTGNWDQAWSGVQQMFSGFVDAVKGLVNGTLKTVFTDLPNFIKGVFSGAGSWLVNAGRNIVQGLIDGVGQMASRLWDSVTSLAKGAVDKVKGALGIHSPSTVFRDEVGKQIPAGVAQGIDSGKTLVDRAATDLFTIPRLTASSILAAATTQASTTSIPIPTSGTPVFVFPDVIRVPLIVNGAQLDAYIDGRALAAQVKTADSLPMRRGGRGR